MKCDCVPEMKRSDGSCIYDNCKDKKPIEKNKEQFIVWWLNLPLVRKTERDKECAWQGWNGHKNFSSKSKDISMKLFCALCDCQTKHHQIIKDKWVCIEKHN